jgi:transcriptional regulator with PAS, ATPase and Fis domain
MVANESITLTNVDRDEVIKLTNSLSTKNSGYRYIVTKNRGNIVVKRVLPETKFDIGLYLASINKSTFRRLLKENKSKGDVANILGVSERSVYRLIDRHGIN